MENPEYLDPEEHTPETLQMVIERLKPIIERYRKARARAKELENDS